MKKRMIIIYASKTLPMTEKIMVTIVDGNGNNFDCEVILFILLMMMVILVLKINGTMKCFL